MTVSADTTQLAAVPEPAAAQGVIPNPAAFDVLRSTGEGINFAPTTQLSNELNPERQPIDSILTGAEAGGDLNFELSKSAGFESLLAAAFGSDWNANVLKVGNELRTHTIQKRFETDPVAPAYAFHRFPGSAVSTFTLNVAPNQPANGSFNFTGQTLELGVAELAGAAYTPAGTNPIMTAPRVDEIEFFGAPVGDCVSNLVLALNNNIRGLECIGTLGFDALSIGRFEVEIQMSIYFSSNAIMQRLIDQTEGDLIFRTRDSGANFYRWTVPRLKISNSELVAAGTNQDVIYNLTLSGLYDPTLATSIQCERN